jgi:hypothetical protein
VETDPLLVRLWPDAPAALEAIIYRALRRRPEQRYGSMADMACDLGHFDRVVCPTSANATSRRPRLSVICLPGAQPSRFWRLFFGILLLAGVAGECCTMLPHPDNLN